jgi:hypothetical protein
MAKKRKEKDEEEEKPFKLPKFDEKAFLKREKRNIKTTIISFLFGILMAFICFGFWVLMGDNALRWELVLLVGVINAAFLRYIFIRLKIDLTDFARKNWFGSYAVYFFTWLIIFIVIVNPPFYDDESPLIDMVELPGMQEPGGNVMILAKITDNAGIEKKDIEFELKDPDGSTLSPDFDYENNIFSYTNEGPDNISEDMTYEYTITVTDHSGHKKIKTGDFTYSEDTIMLALPDPGDEVKAADDVKFSVKADIDRVYYIIEDYEINATESDRESLYVTNPEFEGWPINENVTIQIIAEVIYYFENHIVDGNFPKYNNTIVDTKTYNLSVADESLIGTKPSPEIKLPGPRFKSAPGFELLILIISLIAVIIISRKRKKDRSKQK